jgi:hypothetical protein
MIRGGTRSGRIAFVGVCVLGALAVAAPTTVVAQPAVDEYSLDIPSGGNGSSDSSGTPSTGASTSGAPTSSEGSSGGGAAESAGGGGEGGGADASGPTGKETGARADEELQLGELHDGGPRALGTSSRSAPEVVADTLLDGAMWPLLAALLAITGFGAWRVLRGRGILSRPAG